MQWGHAGRLIRRGPPCPLQVFWSGSPQGWRPFGPAPLRLSRLLGLLGSGRRKPQLQQRATGFIPATNQAGVCTQATDERWPGCCRAGSQGSAQRLAASNLTGPLGTPRSQGGERGAVLPSGAVGVQHGSAAGPLGAGWRGGAKPLRSMPLRLALARADARLAVLAPGQHCSCGASGRCSPLHPSHGHSPRPRL